MNIVVAITGASGSIYARQCLELLIADRNVERIGLILSDISNSIAEYEGVDLPHSNKVEIFDNEDLYAPFASGSSDWHAMIVAPCSTGTMSRIASGVSDSLICRAADVMLKERRRLVLLLRETPLSLIHLRNMTTITEAGGIIMPACPSYYKKPTSIEALAMSVSSRAVEMCGADGAINRWK